MHLNVVSKTHKSAVDCLEASKSILGVILTLNALKTIVLASIHSP